jgi:REP element-mobilizing transposase RayT
MVTWTTYGSWLQGDKRKYVKDAQILPANESLAESNREVLTKEPVRLTRQHRQIVEDAIRRKAIEFGQQIYALAVCYNHLHLVVSYIPKPIDFVVQHYKAAGLIALRKAGIQCKIWTKGFNTRYCFDEHTLQQKINYVTKNPKNT